MTSAEIRQQFLDFFKDKGHTIVRSAPVVPNDDPTLLFTNAGMNQFKDVFVGTGTRPYNRAVDSQKCIRVSGKHNDLEEVGMDTYHHTLFEMLGNWSFGDYYKEEAISWAWELITGVWKLPKDRLWATVFRDDDEADALWKKVTDIAPERVLRCDEKDNFWEMGATGPCGPCSEIHFDMGEGHCDKQHEKGHVCEVNAGCSRYIELWNLVFMQYYRDEDGKLDPLPATHVDTGMGFERIVSVLQGKTSNYHTDLFVPIMEKISEVSGQQLQTGVNESSFQVIADHIRALSFAIADGAIPSNEGRGYVLRRILRRAVRHGKLLDMHKPFLYKLVGTLAEVMGGAYPELVEQRETVEKIIRAEEEQFIKTLDAGLAHLAGIADTVKKDGGDTIPGGEVFKLYDTYGFPVDLTDLIAREKGLKIDQAGFDAQMEAQKQRAREASRFKAAGRSDLGEWNTVSEGESEFTGYDSLEENTTVLRYRGKDKDIELVLDKTPFYAESGGQVGDTGVITGDGFKVTVTDTVKDGDSLVHRGILETGNPAKAGTVAATVDADKRHATERNHTATHILHRALKKVLGDHVNQAGSMVSPERLRFDFNHFSGMTREELDEVERIANNTLLANTPVHTYLTDIDTAKADGATALFGEKYGDTVRVVKIEGYSMELCGGTHVARIGDIARIKIVSESSVASGIRRLEAVTGSVAYAFEKNTENTVFALAGMLNCGVSEVMEKVERLQKQNKELQKELKEGGARSFDADALLNVAVQKEGFKIAAGVVDCKNPGDLRTFGDAVRDKIGSGVAVLAAKLNGKVSICAVVTKDMTEKGVHAGKLIKELSAIMDGKGGGQPHYAQGGGQNVAKLDEALAAVGDIVAGQL